MALFEITMKPTGMSRFKNGKRLHEISYRLSAGDTNEAAQKARHAAEVDGFEMYAITKIKDVAYER